MGGVSSQSLLFFDSPMCVVSGETGFLDIVTVVVTKTEVGENVWGGLIPDIGAHDRLIDCLVHSMVRG